ncbi:MAG: molybdenum cofactor biosynthesis protein MoaE [Gammaproteobacteria bacterium]|nr:molybdenum cofactor biosynthesis protein MoaE [Gammaproteobacteria bacterium]
MKIEIRDTPFDPLQELAHYQESLIALRGHYGAAAHFIGAMRDHNEGSAVTGMTLEHYPGMTERHLESIVQQARQRWEILEALLIHRIGALKPNDPIVLVAVWAAHRAAAFDACRFVMEELKSRAPLWKKEQLAHGERWVEHNTPG